MMRLLQESKVVEGVDDVLLVVLLPELVLEGAAAAGVVVLLALFLLLLVLLVGGPRQGLALAEVLLQVGQLGGHVGGGDDQVQRS